MLLKRIAPIQAIQKGLNEVNIIDLVKKNPRVKSILLLKERPLDAEVRLSLVSLPTTVSDEQKRTIDFLCQFLYTADTKVLQVCLQFITGASLVPPMGFPHPISLSLTPENKLPSASCALSLELSTLCTTSEDFEKTMKTALYEHGGFHCV